MTKLSEHFSLDEMDCHDPQYPTPPWAIEPLKKLCVVLELVRAHFCKPVTITSGFRPTAYQAKLFAEAVKKYGSQEAARQHVAPPGNSQHELGNAADIQIAGVSPRDVAKFAKTLKGVGGVGTYATFTHIDVRPHVPGKPATWEG